MDPNAKQKRTKQQQQLDSVYRVFHRRCCGFFFSLSVAATLNGGVDPENEDSFKLERGWKGHGQRDPFLFAPFRLRWTIRDWRPAVTDACFFFFFRFYLVFGSRIKKTKQNKTVASMASPSDLGRPAELLEKLDQSFCFWWKGSVGCFTGFYRVLGLCRGSCPGIILCGFFQRP